MIAFALLVALVSTGCKRTDKEKAAIHAELESLKA